MRKADERGTCNYGVFLSILEIVLFFKPRFSKKKKKTTPHNIPDAARLTAGGRVTLNPGQGRGPRVSSSTAEQARFNRHVRRSTGRNAAFFRRPARFSEHGVRLAATACLPARFRPDCILSNSPARWCRARRRTRSECSPCRWRRWSGCKRSCPCPGSAGRTCWGWTRARTLRPWAGLRTHERKKIFFRWTLFRQTAHSHDSPPTCWLRFPVMLSCTRSGRSLLLRRK